jgi:RNA recognition motif-containing protein
MTSVKRTKFPTEATSILFVRNLPYKIANTELYDVFGKYGPIRQIRLGNAPSTRGTAYVVYQDVKDAKAASDHLSGFSVSGRYLVCGFFRSKSSQGRGGNKDEEMKDE